MKHRGIDEAQVERVALWRFTLRVAGTIGLQGGALMGASGFNQYAVPRPFGTTGISVWAPDFWLKAPCHVHPLGTKEGCTSMEEQGEVR